MAEAKAEAERSGRGRPTLLYATKRLELAIRARLEEMLQGSGVTALQYTALTVLAVREGVTAAQLARDSFVTPQAMADMLRVMERSELIDRRPNPTNGRERLVSITDRGRAVVETHAQAARELERRMTADWSPRDVEAFHGALESSWRALR